MKFSRRLILGRCGRVVLAMILIGFTGPMATSSGEEPNKKRPKVYNPFDRVNLTAPYGDDNPFGEKKPVLDEKAKAERRLARLREIAHREVSGVIRLGESLALRAMGYPSGYRVGDGAVDGTLSLLHRNWIDQAAGKNKKTIDLPLLRLYSGRQVHRDQIDLLDRIVRHTWKPARGESITKTLERFRNAPLLDERREPGFITTHLVGKQYDLLIKQAAEHSYKIKQPWPFAWRKNQQFWLELITTIEKAKKSADPAAVFRKQIADDPKSGDWYRFAYLRVVRQRRAKQVDMDLVRPLLATTSPDRRIYRVCDILAAIASTQTAQEHAGRAELSRMLIKGVPKKKAVSRVIVEGMAQLYLHDHQRRESLRRWMLATLLPVQLAKVTAASDDQLWRWFLRKRVVIEAKQRPRSEVIAQLRSEVLLPIWFDDAVTRDATPVTISADGRWLSVLDQVLAGSSHRVRFLRSNLIWVGPEDRLAAAEKTLQRGLARLPTVKSRTRTILLKTTAPGFIETPIDEAVDFLSHLYEQPMTTVGLRDTPTLNTSVGDVPLYLALTVIAQQAKLDWYATDEIVALSTPEKIAALRKAERRRQRILVTAGGRVARELSEATEIEFIETPLVEAHDFLRHLHGVPIVILGQKTQDVPVTLNLRGTSLSTAIMLMTTSHGLDWLVDDALIALGTPKQVRQYAELAESRSRRRQAYGSALAKRLTAPLKVMLLDAKPAAVAEYLSKRSGIQVSIKADSKIVALPNISTAPDQNPFPLDALLDAWSVRYDLTWKVVDGGIVITPQKRVAKPSR
jgi:hypothetical protein